MKIGFFVLLGVLCLSLTGVQGKERRRSKKPRLNELNNVRQGGASQKITVYKLAEQSDLPADYKEKPHKYELTQIGVLDDQSGNKESLKALCIIARRKRSLFVDPHRENYVEKTEILKTSDGRRGRARQDNGFKIEIREPFVFRGYVSRDQLVNNAAQNYVRSGRPASGQKENSARWGSWYWPYYYYPPSPTTSTTSFNQLYPTYLSGLTTLSGPLVIQQPAPIVASSGNSNCIITKAIQIDTSGRPVMTAQQLVFRN